VDWVLKSHGTAFVSSVLVGEYKRARSRRSKHFMKKTSGTRVEAIWDEVLNRAFCNTFISRRKLSSGFTRNIIKIRRACVKYAKQAAKQANKLMDGRRSNN
jgi:hypothetical protein